MKIAIFACHFKQLTGGSEYQSYIYAEEFKRRGHEIFYVSFDKVLPEKKFTIDGDCVYSFGIGWLNKIPILRNGDTYFVKRRHVNAILNRERPNIIVCLGDRSILGIAVALRAKYKYKVIWICPSDSTFFPKGGWRAPLAWIGNRLLHYGIRNADRHFVQNKKQANIFENLYPGVEYSFLNNMQPVPSKQDVVKSNPPLVLWVANLKKMKQPEKFIDLAESFRNRSDIYFVMIGRDNYNKIKEIRQRISSLPNIDYLGELEQSEVNEWLDKASLLVNTSEYEGFSNTFVQAWMRKTPVITLKVNPSQILDHEKIGACAGDIPIQLHELVKSFAENPSKCREYGERGYHYAVENHSPDVVFPKMLECLEQVTSLPSKKP